MDRRSILKAVAAAPAIVAVKYEATANPETMPQEDSWTASKFIELPLQPGDEIIGLTSFQGELWAATRFGEVYRIRNDFL